MKILEALIEILKGRGARSLVLWFCLCCATILLFKAADPYPLTRNATAGIAVFHAIVVFVAPELVGAWKRRRGNRTPAQAQKPSTAGETTDGRKTP